MGALESSLVGTGMWDIQAQAIADAIANAGASAAALSSLTFKSNITVIPLGDSITQGNSAFDATNNVWHLASGAYAEQACFRAGGRFSVLSNAGITGQNSTQIRARLFTDVINKSPDLCLLCAGTNDILTGMTTAQKQTLMHNLEYMVQQLLGAGIAVILVTPPAKSSTATGSVETRSMIPFYYELANFYSLPLVDAHKLTTDPVTGDYLAGFSVDGVHPAGPGVIAIANEVASALNNLAGYGAGLYFPAYTDPSTPRDYNLIQNGNMVQQTVANIPDFMGPNTANTTFDGTGVAPLPTMGKNWKVTRAASGGQYMVFGPTIAAANFSAGDILRWCGRIKVSGFPASPAGFSLIGTWNDGGQVQPLNSMQIEGEYLFAHDFPAHASGFTQSMFVLDSGVYELSGLTLINRSAMGRIWTAGTKQV